MDQKGNKASVKKQIESKCGTKMGPWNKKMKKANAKEQIKSKRRTKI
jgi:hypothetical protein